LAAKGGRSAGSVHLQETGMEQSDIVKKEILGMGLDDVTDLYEIIWRLNTLWPERDIAKKYQLADEALRKLLKQNGVRIIKQRAENDQRFYEEVDSKKIDEMLRSPESWYPSVSDDPWLQIAYETTNIGEALYKDFDRLE
jgi:hypothetical protein